MSVSLLIPWSFCQYGYVVQFEIEHSDTTNIIFVQDWFSYVWSIFWFPCKFSDTLFISVKIIDGIFKEILLDL